MNEKELVSGGDAPFLVVLGIAQDAGYPQAGCRKECCARAWSEPNRRRHAVTVAIVDPKTKQRWFLDCSPDFREQLRELNQIAPPDKFPGIDGIFPTHAHMGHYTGLLHLGREVMGTQEVPVYAMPRMRSFLETNGPWEQLVELGHERMYRGAYAVGRPDSVGGMQDGINEAKDFAKALKAVGHYQAGCLPPVLDYEKYSGKGVAANLDYIEGWVKTIEDELGRSPMI
ncbi:MAG: MBL fold metallo-hydrolase, partial [Akkermansiaceae bacterium]